MTEEQGISTGPPLPVESGDINYAMAAVAGVVAAAAGAGVWYGIVVATDTMLGIVAIGVGFLVGKAVWFGAGKQGAAGLQIMGAVLALLAIIAGDYLTLNHWIRQSEELSFTGWLTLTQFIEIYKSYLGETPMTFLFYGIAIYEGYILPKGEDPLSVAPE